MSNRNQDFSCSNEYVFYDDSYNLQPGNAELPDELHTSDDPYVLATLRNVFSEAPSEDYELVYEAEKSKMPEKSPKPAQNFSNPQNQPNNLNHIPFSRHPHEDEDHEEEDDDEMGDEGRREVYHCTECNKTYTSERRLKHHLVVHKNKEAYKCPKCGYCYQSPDSLKRHMKKSTDCNPESVQNDGGPVQNSGPQ